MTGTLRCIPGVISVVFFLIFVPVTHAQLELQAVPAESESIPAYTPVWTDYNDSDPGVVDGSDTRENRGIETEDIGITAPQESVDEDNEEFGDSESEEVTESNRGTGLVLPDEPVESADMFIEIKGIEGDSENRNDFDDSFGFSVESEMNKADLINRLATEPTETRAVFLRFDGVEGESDDSGSAGGGAAKKPKEIVVVGSKVRDWDPVKKEEIIGSAPSDPDMVTSSSDLALFLTAGTEADSRMEEVTFNYEKIKFDYNTEIKLLGFLAVPMRASYEVEVVGDPESLGRIKVQMPWWHVFGRKTVRPRDLAAATPAAAGENEHTKAALIFAAVSKVLQTSHGATETCDAVDQDCTGDDDVSATGINCGAGTVLEDDVCVPEKLDDDDDNDSIPTKESDSTELRSSAYLKIDDIKGDASPD